ncbi:hypothetical protein KS4_18350 [Poriferisphaera corsica]|uniref:Uncharacterized protein n=1 Tax=Poriferisphaera corsica TaxID=2528020 RepID=A0A517YU85_9BACT|nr:hypothetical protein [Poriferisphaera corsica]QDU33778.1 hypothetical protein KS4_18350 [Poriferisphaera corsica]
MNTLFDNVPDELQEKPSILAATTRPPVARQNQRAGLRKANKEPCVRAHVASELLKAGPVRVLDGTVVGGATIQELRLLVTERRDKETKETTITQPLKDLRESGHVIDSGYSRVGNSGVMNTVWAHRAAK